MTYTLTPDELDRWNAARAHSGHAPLTMDEAQQKLDAMDEADRAFALAFIREGRP